MDKAGHEHKFNEKKFQKALMKTKVIYLSTSKDDNISSRPVSPINDGLTLYIKTEDDSLKAMQMEANPHVAINFDKYYMAGKVRFLGSTELPKNQRLKELYRQKYPEAFTDRDVYSAQSDIFIAIDLKKVSEWVLEGAIGHISEWNLE